MQKKILDTWKRIEDAYNNSEKRGKLTIYRLKTYPTRSIFLTESMLIEIPYQVASGRTNIPAFRYRKVASSDSLYDFAKRDVEALREEAIQEKSFG